MTDSLKLKSAIVLAGLTMSKVAKRMGVSTYTLHKKMYNITEFKASEITALTQILNIKDVEAVFFNQPSD